MSTTPLRGAWVSRPRPDPNARIRLFCFPSAGGGATMFRTWVDALPRWIEVCPVQLPGRESRLGERPFERLTALVPALVEALDPWLSTPFALFGHSVGALIAFALARELRARGKAAPTQLFVSGRQAPHLRFRDPLHPLPKPLLLAKVRRMGGTPEMVLREPELMEIFLPILRADIAVNEAEAIAAEAPLDCPILALGGQEDERANRAELEAWREHTRGAFAVEMFPGGHFFVRSAEGALLRSVAQALGGSGAAL